MKLYVKKVWKEIGAVWGVYLLSLGLMPVVSTVLFILLYVGYITKESALSVFLVTACISFIFNFPTALMLCSQKEYYPEPEDDDFKGYN